MIWLLAAPVLAIGGLFGWRFGFAAFQRFCRDWRVPALDRVVALTFDDGPDPAGTAGVLDDLAAAGVKATFFLLGERVRAHPDLARRIAAEGHEVAVHGWTHRNTATLTRATLDRHLAEARRAVAEVCGRAPTLYRPAYGVLAPAAARAARSAGLTPWLWTTWARDWKVRPPAAIQADLARGLAPGGVLLLHDGESTGGQSGAAENMREALRPFLAGARESGWEFATLGGLLDRAGNLRTKAG